MNVSPDEQMRRTPGELASLVQRAQRHEGDAFEVLVDEYSARLYGFLFRLTGHRNDAEDLVQEVFVRVVRMIAQYRDEGRFEAWLFHIALNLARDRIRRITRTPATVSLGDANGNEQGNPTPLPRAGNRSAAPPAQALEMAEDVDRLQHCLARLPDEEREVVMLRHHTSLSFAEIAEAMGTPLGTALARAHRGLLKLRRWMEGSS